MSTKCMFSLVGRFTGQLRLQTKHFKGAIKIKEQGAERRDSNGGEERERKGGRIGRARERGNGEQAEEERESKKEGEQGIEERESKG